MRAGATKTMVPSLMGFFVAWVFCILIQAEAACRLESEDCHPVEVIDPDQSTRVSGTAHFVDVPGSSDKMNVEFDFPTGLTSTGSRCRRVVVIKDWIQNGDYYKVVDIFEAGTELEVKGLKKRTLHKKGKLEYFKSCETEGGGRKYMDEMETVPLDILYEGGSVLITCVPHNIRLDDRSNRSELTGSGLSNEEIGRMAEDAQKMLPLELRPWVSRFRLKPESLLYQKILTAASSGAIKCGDDNGTKIGTESDLPDFLLCKSSKNCLENQVCIRRLGEENGAEECMERSELRCPRNIPSEGRKWFVDLPKDCWRSECEAIKKGKQFATLQTAIDDCTRFLRSGDGVGEVELSGTVARIKPFVKNCSDVTSFSCHRHKFGVSGPIQSRLLVNSTCTKEWEVDVKDIINNGGKVSCDGELAGNGARFHFNYYPSTKADLATKDITSTNDEKGKKGKGDKKNEGSNTGIIVAIVAVFIVLIVIGLAVGFLVFRLQKQKKRNSQDHDSATTMNSSMTTATTDATTTAPTSIWATKRLSETMVARTTPQTFADTTTSSDGLGPTPPAQKMKQDYESLTLQASHKPSFQSYQPSPSNQPLLSGATTSSPSSDHTIESLVKASNKGRSGASGKRKRF